MADITLGGSSKLTATNESTTTIIVSGDTELVVASFSNISGANPSSYQNQVVIKDLGYVFAPTPNPTKTNFAFIGWSLTVEDQVAVVFPITISTNTILYAIWEPSPTVFATFNVNGGNESYSEVSGPMPLYVSSPGTPTRNGYTFLGWSPELPTIINRDTTFVARWGSPNLTTLTFDPPTGNGATNAYVYYDSFMPLAGYYIDEGLPVPVNPMTPPTQAGKIFDGYFDDDDHLGVQYYASDMTSVKNWDKVVSTAFMYAKWTDIPKTATPETSTFAVTSSSVSFKVKNKDSDNATISWEIRESSAGGILRASGTTSSLAFNGEVTVSYNSASASTTYYLVNVYANASGKLQSDAGIQRNMTTLSGSTITETPTVQSISCFYSGITNTYYLQATIKNNEAASVSMEISDSISFPSGKITTTFTSGQTRTLTVETASATFAGSTYTYYARATASGKTVSSIAQRTQSVSSCAQID